MGTTYFVAITGPIDRALSLLIWNRLFLRNMIAAPGGTTHLKIISAGAELILRPETFCCF
jgi:hypothetical protein